MTKRKILSLEELLELRAEWKKDGLKVVFTNGCFDIVHLGHIDYLEKASSLADKMIIGLNSDKSVGSIKGGERPIVQEESRSRLLAALEFVDAVVLFDNDTPEQLISQVIPDILVKGDDYSIENIVGADVVLANGGSVETVTLVDGYSTSSIIDKIRKGSY